MSSAPDPTETSTPAERLPVTVIVIHRDRPDAIGRTVSAFLDQSAATKVIVVDNGSATETVAALPGVIGEAELIITGENLGFGPGGNVGLRHFLTRKRGSGSPSPPTTRSLTRTRSKRCSLQSTIGRVWV